MDRLMTREEMIAAGYPFGKAGEGVPLGDPKTEWQRTKPDICVFLPDKTGQNYNDNCVLAVTPSPDRKELLAVWTQSSVECNGDNRIVIARSADGVHWSAPEYVIGARNDRELQSSWAMPMITESGRLYLFYIQETPVHDSSRVGSGDLGLIFSDDGGHTWSAPGIAPLPRSRYDHPDPKIPKNWWTWQRPIRDAKGRFVAGFTTQVSPYHLTEPDVFPSTSTRAGIIRFDNLDDDPLPCDVKVSLLPLDGLGLPQRNRPEKTVANESATVLLPDGRIFITMRSLTGYACYSVCDPDGKTWQEPRPILQDNGFPFLHPLGPLPMYRLKDGRYLLFFNNNDGIRNGENQYIKASEFGLLRNPYYMSVGVYDPYDKYQPVRFGKPVQIIDTEDIAVCPRKHTVAASMYADITEWNGKRILWYPDRKFYILGKEIPDTLIDPITPSGEKSYA